MTNQKLTALMLAGALALGLCGGAVLAADPVEPDTSANISDCKNKTF